MMTSLVDMEAARTRLASGEPAYAFQISDDSTILGPACKYGADYLRKMRTEGGYAESFEEAAQITDARGTTIIGVWFVKC